MTRSRSSGPSCFLLSSTPALAQFAPGELNDYTPSEGALPDQPAEAAQPAVDEPTDAVQPPETANPTESVNETTSSDGDDQVDERAGYWAPTPPPPPPPPPPSPWTAFPETSQSPPPPPPPPPPATVPYGYVLVSGAGVNEFYYVRQDHFNRLSGANPFEKLRSILSYNAFGPHPAGSQVRVRQRANYYFFPICNYQLSWARRGFANVPEGSNLPKIELRCP